jgi:hypothetical protein
VAFKDGHIGRLRELLMLAVDDDALVRVSRRAGGACAPYGVARVLAELRGRPDRVSEDRLFVATNAVRIVAGDLHLTGELRIVGNLIVTGDVSVDGVVRDCGPDSRVAIVGNLEARGVWTDGDFYVGGDLDARVVYGHYNDNSLRIGGTLRADLVIEDDHDVRATSIVSPHHFDIDTYGLGADRALSGILVPEVFATDEEDDEEPPHLDVDALFGRLASGKPVFR